MFDDNLSDLLILVDENDNQIGAAPKLQAHQEALLHRAFSVFLFDQDGRMLLTRRASGKYHSGGLWTNACCSHPR
ncbi:MAG: NUDIX domain-containing protein, partial [Coriobacteriales bacterium]|nr:NUDIX domain-containing protein [Coriobacteriales bacterium]